MEICKDEIESNKKLFISGYSITFSISQGYEKLNLEDLFFSHLSITDFLYSNNNRNLL